TATCAPQPGGGSWIPTSRYSTPTIVSTDPPYVAATTPAERSQCGGMWPTWFCPPAVKPNETPKPPGGGTSGAPPTTHGPNGAISPCGAQLCVTRSATVSVIGAPAGVADVHMNRSLSQTTSTSGWGRRRSTCPGRMFPCSGPWTAASAYPCPGTVHSTLITT